MSETDKRNDSFHAGSEIVLVRGSGDVGSAVAHLLFQNGYRVLIHETASPSATRRKMAFTDAVFDGTSTLENVTAQRVDDLLQIIPLLSEHRLIPLVTIDFDQVLQNIRPTILVDARMRKHHQPEVQIHLAPLTIGLGPNFEAGLTTHLAVETGWGEELGKVIRSGKTKPLHGEPQSIAGHARDRYVYAPLQGVFRTKLTIGAPVEQGQVIARIGEQPLTAPITGVLRGLTHDGVEVAAGTKVIEVDPRLEEAQITGIGARPKQIALGVWKAIQLSLREGG